MKNKIILIRTLALVLPLLLVGGFLLAATPVLQPKYISVSPEGSLTAEYYDHVAATQHDVLFVGDCEVYESFIPAVLWDEYGISAYVRGSAQQLVWQSYYMLEDALRYETPKVVVFNVLSLKYGEPQNEAFNRMTLDGMAWSPVKLEAVMASMTEEESLASYVWPLLRFHSRWSELTEEDFKYAFAHKPTVSDSGYLMQTAIVPANEGGMAEGESLMDYTLPETSWAYLDKMRVLCEERGITLVLIKAPTNSFRYWWYDEWDEQVVAYAQEYDLDYYNMIPAADEIGIDWQTDTYDAGVHLNVYGAEKLSCWFGERLQENYDLPDRRTQEDYAHVWQERVDIYHERKNEMKEGQ